MLEELERRLNKKIRENSDSIHEMHEDFTDVCSKLVKKFAEEGMTRDEKILQNEKLTNDLFDKLQRQVTDETNALESQVVDTKQRHEERDDKKEGEDEGADTEATGGKKAKPNEF